MNEDSNRLKRPLEAKAWDLGKEDLYYNSKLMVWLLIEEKEKHEWMLIF
jgi:hypothetical protein